MGVRIQKTIVTLFAMALAIAFGAIVLGCSSSGGAASATKAVSSSSASESASSSAVSSADSSVATSDASEAASSDGASSEAQMGSGFVGTWEYSGSDGKMVIELDSDETGRVMVYSPGSAEPTLKEPISWRATSEGNGSIWIGGNHPMKLLQDGKALELDLRDLESMGTLSDQATTGVFYKK